MIVNTIKTRTILAGEQKLTELLDEYLKEFKENTVLVITSKVVSLCENRVIPIKDTDKDTLVKEQSSYYLSSNLSKYGYHFTITDHTLISMSGIDESNGNGNFILWPSDSQKTANEVRTYLVNRFGIKYAGVLIVDSTCTPLRLGTSGIAIGFSGFQALNNYVGKPDLFGRPFQVSQANIAGGLASTAVLAMGEGTERMPLAVISDIPFVKFQDRDPSLEELETTHIPFEDDLFEPFFSSVKWEKGNRSNIQG